LGGAALSALREMLGEALAAEVNGTELFPRPASGFLEMRGISPHFRSIVLSFYAMRKGLGAANTMHRSFTSLRMTA